VSPTLESVWVIPALVHSIPPEQPHQELLLAFSPAYKIGALHAGFGSITWFSVTHEGQPRSIIEKPATGPVDIILYRLSQAYTSVLIASHPTNPPGWKARIFWLATLASS